MNAYTYDFKKLKQSYGEFSYPMIKLVINNKDLTERRDDFIINNLELELSSGFEASALTFSIYNSFDSEKNQYSVDKIKKYILLGAAVCMELGYAGKTKEVFKGFIANVSFMCGENEAHHMEVTALDVKGIMMSNSYSKQMTASNYGDGIKELFQGSAYQKMLSAGIYTDIKITDTADKNANSNQKLKDPIDMVSESDYDFLVKAARRFNYEFFVENGVVLFRKAKVNKEVLILLGMDRGILNYDINYDITGLVETVEVRGVDTKKGEIISVSKKISNKISLGNKAKALISNTQKVYVDGGIHSKEQGQYRLDSLVEEMSYRFGKIKCVCIGMPEILPGNFIEIGGLGLAVDNCFYITNVRHTITDEGDFITQIEGRTAMINGG